MAMTRLVAAVSLGKKKAILDISKSFCYQNNRVTASALFTSGPNPTDPGQKREAEDGSGVSGYVAEKAKEGTKSAVETVVQMGDTAKKVADDAWGRTKETAQKIRETVVGGEGRGEAAAAEPKTRTPTDSSVEDVRKRSGGYD